MKKKTEVPTNNPAALKTKEPKQGQRNNTPTREDIAADRPEEYNANAGTGGRSLNKGQK